MNVLRAAMRQLLHLVVDDAGLALGLLLWCALMAALIQGAGLAATAAGLLLAAGCLLVLLASVWRAGRRG